MLVLCLMGRSERAAAHATLALSHCLRDDGDSGARPGGRGTGVIQLLRGRSHESHVPYGEGGPALLGHLHLVRLVLHHFLDRRDRVTLAANSYESHLTFFACP